VKLIELELLVQLECHRRHAKRILIAGSAYVPDLRPFG
jgi:hypothetical protein